MPRLPVSPDAGPVETSGPAARRRGDFVVVLVLLSLSYVLYAATPSGLVQAVVALLYLAAAAFAFRSAEPTPRQRRALWVTGVFAVVVVGVAWLAASPRVAQAVASASIALVLLITLVAVLTSVTRQPEVTGQSIAGALSAYLLLGMMYGALYGMLARFGTEPFFASGEAGDVRSFQYFSFITLTTTGYGDLVPGSHAGRGLAALEALTGQVFLATLVAALVAAYRRPARRHPPSE